MAQAIRPCLPALVSRITACGCFLPITAVQHTCIYPRSRLWDLSYSRHPIARLHAYLKARVTRVGYPPLRAACIPRPFPPRKPRHGVELGLVPCVAMHTAGARTAHDTRPPRPSVRVRRYVGSVLLQPLPSAHVCFEDLETPHASPPVRRAYVTATRFRTAFPTRASPCPDTLETAGVRMLSQRRVGAPVYTSKLADARETRLASTADGFGNRVRASGPRGGVLGRQLRRELRDRGRIARLERAGD